MTRQQTTGPAGDSSPARPRPRFTSRAAVLVVVVCAIALSLAYPVREYIAQRQQIDQLLALQQTTAAEVQALQEEKGKLSQTWYVEREAEDQLHMCFPRDTCYAVVTSTQAAARATARNVLPVPAGPIPNVIVLSRIEST